MAKDGKTTFYRTAEGQKYHRDRQCFFLRRAVERNAVLSLQEPDPGIGRSLLIQRPGHVTSRRLMSCSRCGK